MKRSDDSDKKGDNIVAYLDSPNFVNISGNATRLVNKLKTAIQKQELYETHQILRTIYFRFINNDGKVAALIELLYHGAHYLIDNSETISGQDVANLFVESSARLLQCRSSDHDLSKGFNNEELCRKISNIAIKLPDTEVGQTKFIAETLKLLKPKILNRDLLHAAIAERQWAARNYSGARYHFLHCANLDNSNSVASFLIEYHSQKAHSNEVDIFLTQFLFQLLCIQSPLDTPIQSSSKQTVSSTSSSIKRAARKSRSTIKSAAQKIFAIYTMRHPLIRQQEPPFTSLPLLNFTHFLITILDSNSQEHNTFKLLCDIYKPSWDRDPNNQSYLNRIGILYFGLTDQNKQQQQGGFLNNILMSLMDGAEGDDEEEDGPIMNAQSISSCDELD